MVSFGVNISRTVGYPPESISSTSSTAGLSLSPTVCFPVSFSTILDSRTSKLSVSGYRLWAAGDCPTCETIVCSREDSFEGAIAQATDCIVCSRCTMMFGGVEHAGPWLIGAWDCYYIGARRCDPSVVNLIIKAGLLMLLMRLGRLPVRQVVLGIRVLVSYWKILRRFRSHTFEWSIPPNLQYSADLCPWLTSALHRTPWSVARSRSWTTKAVEGRYRSCREPYCTVPWALA